MKRTLTAVLLVAAMIFTMVSPAFAQFSDVKGHWAENEINKWADKGIAGGFDNGTFRPDRPVTRAEFVTMINKAFGFKVLSREKFSDVSLKDWFAKDIKKAVAAGYMGGYKNKTFRPNSKVTRQDAAVAAAKLMKLDIPDNLDELNKFKDKRAIAKDARGAVNIVVAKGYMAGFENKTFKPNKPMTRADVIVLIDKMLSGMQTKGVQSISSISAANGTINVVLSGKIEGLLAGDFNVSAKLNDNAYLLQNLTFNAANNSFSFTPVAQTSSAQTLSVTVAASGTSKVTGNASTTVTIPSIVYSGSSSYSPSHNPRTYTGEEALAFVKPTDFGVMDFSNVFGYSVGFELLKRKAKDISLIEVTLFEGKNVLATNKSTGLLTKYPDSSVLSSPFDIDSNFTDDFWQYSAWNGTGLNIPDKAVIKVTDKNGDIYIVETGKPTGDVEKLVTAIVFVDDDWAGLEENQPVSKNEPNKVFGVNAFSTIRDGINRVQEGCTVKVAKGLYPESVEITKSLYLIGPQAGVTAGFEGERENGEAVIDPSVDDWWFNVGVYVGANNVIVDGFTIKHSTIGLLGGNLGLFLDSSESSSAKNALLRDYNVNNFTIQNNRFIDNEVSIAVGDYGYYLDAKSASLGQVSHGVKIWNNLLRADGYDEYYNERNLKEVKSLNTEGRPEGIWNKVIDELESKDENAEQLKALYFGPSKVGIFLFNNNNTSVKGNNISISDKRAVGILSYDPRYWSFQESEAKDLEESEQPINEISSNEIHGNRFGAALLGYSADAKVNLNKIYNNRIALTNLTWHEIDAVKNWWGSAIPGDIFMLLGGHKKLVEYLPWATNSSCTQFANSTMNEAAVDDDWDTLLFGDKVSAGGRDYFIGINAFTSIQSAIDSISYENETEGTTINVLPGLYDEYVNLYKSVNLKGLNIQAKEDENQPVILGKIVVRADNAAVSGFNLNNISSQSEPVEMEISKVPQYETWVLIDANNVTLSDLTINYTYDTNAKYGYNDNSYIITVAEGKNGVSILNNTINKILPEGWKDDANWRSRAGQAAIAVSGGSDLITIKGNKVTNGPIAIKGKGNNNISIQDNEVKGTNDEGIWVVNAESLTITGSSISDYNLHGIQGIKAIKIVGKPSTINSLETMPSDEAFSSTISSANNNATVELGWAGYVNELYTSEAPGFGVNKFATLQTAIDTMTSGSTIFVEQGSYAGGVMVNKSLVIIGVTGAKLGSAAFGNIGYSGGILIQANNVVVSGLTFEANTEAKGYGILILSSTNGAVIKGNTITQYNNGIASEYAEIGSGNNTITDNKVNNSASVGIYLQKGSNNKLTGNTVANSGHADLTIDSETDFDISDNTFTGNAQYRAEMFGIEVPDTLLNGNNFGGEVVVVEIPGGKGIVMKENTKPKELEVAVEPESMAAPQAEMSQAVEQDGNMEVIEAGQPQTEQAPLPGAEQPAEQPQTPSDDVPQPAQNELQIQNDVTNNLENEVQQ